MPRRRNQDASHKATKSVQVVDYDSDDLEVGEIVPTIELSEQSEVYEMEGSDPVAAVEAPIALPLGSLMFTGGVENEFNSSRQSFQRRAEFVSVSILKPTKRTDLGLSLSDLLDGGEGICISAINEKGFLKETGAPLEVGDRIISINNHSCEDMDHKKAAKLLREAPDFVFIVAQNIGGDPLMVESMITKPNPHARTGIGFTSSDSPSRLHISTLFPNGLFADSLLSEGDEVLSVNSIPCRELDASTVADIILASSKYVTVLAKKFGGNGVVVACEEASRTKRWMRKSSTDLPLMEARSLGISPGCQLLACIVFISATSLLILFVQVELQQTVTSMD